MVKQQTQKELVDELTNKMNDSIKNYKNDPSEELKFLDFISRFNNYSVRNISLIQNQFGNAVGVASYKQHKENGYQVQKGEKAIRILAPKFQKMFQDNDRQWKYLNQATTAQKAKIKSGELKTEERLAGFLSVPVFDITQTDCPEQDYPKLYPNKPESFTFNGKKKDIETLRSVLIDYAEEKNVAVSFDKTNSTAKGYFEPATNRIVIKDRMDEVEQIKVLLHELAHAEMHNVHKLATKTPEQLRSSVLEYQAEMTAYVVSSTLGIDSEDYSKKYLANWTKRKVDDDVYIQSLEEVKNVSNNFMNDISQRFDKLFNEISFDKMKAVTKVLNDYHNREFTMDNTVEETIHKIEKNGYHATIGFMEEVDQTSSLCYSKQIEFDLKKEQQVNSLWNEFISVESVYPYPMDDCISDLKNAELEDFFDTDSSFKISVDDVSRMVKLTALTDDSKYLDQFITENHFDLIHVDLDLIHESKNELLRNLDEDTVDFFNLYDVKLPETYIFDHEFQDLIKFQISPYESFKEPRGGEILFIRDISRENETEAFSSYKDLWEKYFKDELNNDLNSYSLKDLQKNEHLAKSPTLLNRLALSDKKTEQTLAALKQQSNTIKELDLDNDGVPDRIDPDDTRSVIRTEADKDLVRNKTDKDLEIDKPTKKRTRTR